MTGTSRTSNRPAKLFFERKVTITMLFTSVFTALVTVAVAIPTGPVAVRSADTGTPAQLGARTEAENKVQADFDCKNLDSYNDCIANGCPFGIPPGACFPALNCYIAFC
ncbi:hypothetical protein MCOR07_011422 [Pyricularia oryzae]|nr:hypothetical protein MCOR01_006788 [Pyricularia oryzae]KAI6305255.1 hypothetical protein MCOR34_008661 [Pyricularia oryzae]KAI6536328.1 hypothetical protein MCOR05_005691 [Pyricularia oryzae]KAI6550065.1 hypothetical protein MCOR09_011413 [Pyricularia oryzae]KAI6609469.1 hypothetical protein MCOR07_011422 [Pyricularia oryzae]